MKVNDKRVKHEEGVFFEELKIGQAYEDGDGVLCIKTNDTDGKYNCIYFVNEKWGVSTERPTTKVIPLVTTLEIER